jgi:hypothetical protein
MSKRVSSFAVPFFALLAACGGGTTTGAVIPAGGLNFPNCSDGQLLGIDATGRGYTCVSVATTSAAAPVCTASQALTVEGGMLKCVEKGTGSTTTELSNQITALEKQYNDLNTKVNDLKTPSGIGSQFVGVTDLKFAGKIVGPKTGVVGVGGAAEACISKFGLGAHMCTPYEMYQSVAAANPAFTSTSTVGKAWVYMIGWNKPTAAQVTGIQATAAADDNAGLGDNCGSYTQGDGTKGWVGTVGSWDVSTYTGAPQAMPHMLRFSISAQTTCDKTFPIACCQ